MAHSLVTLSAAAREAKYFFLSGDEANYSSMAAVYRKYLLETGQLSSSANAGNELALTILIGTGNVRSALGGTICMTTFAQAQQMIEDCLAGGNSLCGSCCGDGHREAVRPRTAASSLPKQRAVKGPAGASGFRGTKRRPCRPGSRCRSAHGGLRRPPPEKGRPAAGKP